MQQEPKTFWERSFDSPKAAKYGCVGVMGTAIISALVGASWLSSAGQSDSNETLAVQPAVMPTISPTPPRQIKTYTAADIEWEYAQDAIPYKMRIVTAINRLLRENDRCADVQTTSLYRAEGFSRRNPEFFIQCDGVDGEPFGVTFNLNDVENGNAALAAVQPIPETSAQNACIQITRRQSDGLTNIVFAALYNGNYIPHNDGRSTITLAFSANDAVGQTANFKAICFFNGNRLTEHTIKHG